MEVVLIIDPGTNAADFSSITGLSGMFKWSDGVLAGNGKVYAWPKMKSAVLTIDADSSDCGGGPGYSDMVTVASVVACTACTSPGGGECTVGACVAGFDTFVDGSATSTVCSGALDLFVSLQFAV